MKMIWARGIHKNLQKRRTRAIALPELAAAKIPHPKHSDHSEFRFLPTRARANFHKTTLFLPGREKGELR